jgi:hypothetical protein
MLKVLVTIVGVAILPIIYTGVTPPTGGVSPTSVPPNKAPAPLLAAGLPAFIALGGGGAVAALVRRSFKSRRQSSASQGRSVV